VEEVLWAHLKDVLSSEGVGNVRTLAQWLVRAGRSIDELRDPAGMEPGYYGPIHRVLHEQCMDVKFARELVDVLVEAGANINATSYMHGPGPVLPTWAVESCRFYPEGLKLLCELPGVDVNQVGCHDDGNDVQMQCTALGLAAEKGDLDMCKCLLAKGAKVNTGSNNVSPLLLVSEPRPAAHPPAHLPACLHPHVRRRLARAHMRGQQHMRATTHKYLLARTHPMPPPQPIIVPAIMVPVTGPHCTASWIDRDRCQHVDMTRVLLHLASAGSAEVYTCAGRSPIPC